MAELCSICAKKRGKKITDGQIISSNDEFFIIICNACLASEIEAFFQEMGILEAKYQNLLLDPFFAIESDSYLSQKIVNRLRVKIYTKGR